MDELEFLIDLHKSQDRQGPGSEPETLKAIKLAGIDPSTPVKIADLGCGTGASAVTLAQHLNADIKAVDCLQTFLDILQARAQSNGVADRITPVCASMCSLPFHDEAFDIIWSEGAIYNMGFEQGILDWRRYLKTGGLLVVSELTWLTGERPGAIQEHWESEYAEVDVASAKIRILEKAGYSPIGYFVLPEYCWLENYYGPLSKSFPLFLQRHDNSSTARAIVDAETLEIDLYQKYKSYYSYGMYIARKTA